MAQKPAELPDPGGGGGAVFRCAGGGGEPGAEGAMVEAVRWLEGASGKTGAEEGAPDPLEAPLAALGQSPWRSTATRRFTA